MERQGPRLGLWNIFCKSHDEADVPRRMLQLKAGPRAATLYMHLRSAIFGVLLELILPHMAQEPMLRGEVGARALRVRSGSREEAWASVGVRGAWVSGCGCEAD